MSLFIRCEWLPHPTCTLDDRITEVAVLLCSTKVERITGKTWHQLATSKAAALRHRVDPSSHKAWRKVPLTTTQVMHRLGLWNGVEGPRSARISVRIHDPSEEVDVLVISAGDSQSLEASGADWEDVLALAEASANKLGGRAIVSSNELLEWAAENNVAHAEAAAYAACWGVDRSGVNPFYKRLAEEHRGSPLCDIACATWAEVRTPSERRLANLINLVRVP